MRRLGALLFALLLAWPLTSADIKMGYGTNGQTLTCTLASLTTGSARACTAVDNSGNKFIDAKFFLKVKSGASATSASGFIDIYVGGSVDGATTYTENFGGTDAGITLTSNPNVKWVGSCNVVANSTTYACGPFSLAAPFSGRLPEHWFVVIVNQSGGTLDGTEGSHAKLWQGEYATSS